MEGDSESTIKVPQFNPTFQTTALRSRMMQKIRSSETRSEKSLRKILWSLGIRFRKNYSSLPGKPDIVIFKYKLAIFIDGEFWHGYDWLNNKDRIKTNREYWIPKIERNIQRDQINNSKLQNLGWTVLRFWEKQVKLQLGTCVKTILDRIS